MAREPYNCLPRSYFLRSHLHQSLATGLHSYRFKAAMVKKKRCDFDSGRRLGSNILVSMFAQQETVLEYCVTLYFVWYKSLDCF